MKDKLLATCVIFGLVGFLYPIYTYLGALQNWDTIDQPAAARALILGTMCGLGAVACALGIDIKPLITNVMGLFKKDGA